MPPPSAIPPPAAVACTAPHVPSANPLSPSRASAIAAVSVPAANNPPPNPISAVPIRNNSTEPKGAAKITAAKANMPATAPKPAMRYGSALRPSVLAASPNPASVPSAKKAVSAVVWPTLSFRISAPYGSSRMSCIENAEVPKASATRTRTEPPDFRNLAQDCWNSGRARAADVSDGLRASCFHSAAMLSSICVTATPWITWIRRISLKFRNSSLKISALPTIPISSIT